MALFSLLTRVDKRRQRTPSSAVSNLSPGRITLGYAVVAILWIAFSDQAVTYLGLDPVVMTIKGVFFVLVTASLLYFTIRRLVQAVQLTSQELRNYVDHAGDALFVQELEHRTIVDVNRQACDSLGFTRQELIGKTPLFFHLDSDRAGIQSAAERAAAGETVFDRHWHRRKDGSLFPAEIQTSVFWYGRAPLPAEGCPGHLVTACGPKNSATGCGNSRRILRTSTG